MRRTSQRPLSLTVLQHGVPARRISVRDLSILLDTQEQRLERQLARKGIRTRQQRRGTVVDWQELTRCLDARELRKIIIAAKKSRFSLSLLSWTVASFPELLAQWDHRRNKGLEPSEVSFRSSRDVYWKCRTAPDHVWSISVNERTHRAPNGEWQTKSCPFCRGHLRSSSTYSLATEFPEVAREWHPTRNGNLRPKDIPPNHAKRVWWQCAKKHEWQTCVYHRTTNHSGCPHCVRQRYLQENSLAAKRPNLAIEWHPTKNGALKPSEVGAFCNKKVWWKCRNVPDHEWQAVVAGRSNGRGCPFCCGHRLAKDNTLASKYPELAREWHASKNGQLTPSKVSGKNPKSVWWKCACGHAWRAAINSRTELRRGCPKCKGHASQASSRPSSSKRTSPRSTRA